MTDNESIEQAARRITYKEVLIALGASIPTLIAFGIAYGTWSTQFSALQEKAATNEAKLVQLAADVRREVNEALGTITEHAEKEGHAGTIPRLQESDRRLNETYRKIDKLEDKVDALKDKVDTNYKALDNKLDQLLRMRMQVPYPRGPTGPGLIDRD